MSNIEPLRSFVQDMTRAWRNMAGTNPPCCARESSCSPALSPRRLAAAGVCTGASRHLPPIPALLRSAGAFLGGEFRLGPGHTTPVHDHTVWGLVGVLRGAEKCEEYERPATAGRCARPASTWSSRAASMRSPDRGRHPHGIERARRSPFDQHPRLRRQHRRGKAPCLCARDRRDQTLRFRLFQQHDPKPVGGSPIQADAALAYPEPVSCDLIDPCFEHP